MRNGWTSCGAPGVPANATGSAGFAFAAEDFLASCDLGELLAWSAAEGVRRTEQTLLAEAAHQLGGRTWPAEEIVCSVDDPLTLRPSYPGKPWVASHYVGQVRHLFWRAVLALRLGVGRRPS